MAKSGGDKVRKGFLFYVFMLLLLLLAAFLVIVVIMLFSPGTSILGYEYFSYNDEPQVVTTLSGVYPTFPPISFAGTNKVVVDTDYASVRIIETEEENDYVKVTNRAKGFAHSGDFTDIQFYVTQDTDALTVHIKEPQAFLYFSKDISVEIGICASSASEIVETEFAISTQSGNVEIDSTEKDSPELNILKLAVSSKNGSITINEKETEVVEGEEEQLVAKTTMLFTSLQLSTDSGRIIVPKNKIINVSGDAKLSVLSNGHIEFGDIIARSGLQLALNNGQFVADTVYGRVRVNNLQNGYVDIKNIKNYNNISGSFDTNDAINIGRANIKIGTVENVSVPVGNEVNVEIGEIFNSALIITTSGNIKITKNAGQNTYLESTTGAIEATLVSGTSLLESTHITSVSGNISVTFDEVVKNQNYLKTNGNVQILIPSQSKFKLDLRNFDDEPIEKLNGKVNISLITDSVYDYPFFIGREETDTDSYFDQNFIQVNCGGNINVMLQEKEA